MEIGIALEGRLDEYMAAEYKAASKATTTSIRRATTNMKNEMRRQIRSAGMGDRLANTWRGDVYPERGISIDAAGFVYSKAPFMEAFENATVIRAKNKKWLAIPSQDALRVKGNRRNRVSDFARSQLRFVPQRGGKHALLVLRQPNGKDVVMFVLVPQVKMRKVIRFKEAAEKWGDRIPQYLISEWERAADNLDIKK